jgi:hypothetical protein
MADDSVRLNIDPAAPIHPDERVAPATGAAAAPGVSDKEGRGAGGRQTSGETRKRGEPETEAAFARLEAEIAAANRDLERHGVAVTLSLHRESDGFHLEIEDRRIADEPARRRVRVISFEDVQRLHRDIVEEAGICVDEVA